tara:strand:- start:217 stop:1344 length:1128 start_codon:yes stop_codon:yes gene_type:complete
MFRYGGPIKEGIMNGMRNGGRIGFQDGTKKRNYNWFETPVGGLFNPKAAALGGKKMIAGGYDLVGVPLNALSRMTIGYNPGFSGAKLMNIKPDKKDTAYWMGIPTSTKEGWTIPSMQEGPTAAEIELAKLKKQIADQKKGGMPEHLGLKSYTDPDAAAKLAKTQQNERLKKYLDMMGYDSAKKGALSKALIDASALVQDATTEAGSIKHADWGNLINRAIQTTSKRLEKPEQIREAVGLMATKAAIQKDMMGEEDALKTEALKLNIEKLKKDLKGNSFSQNKALTGKTHPGQAGFDLAVELTEDTDFKGNLVASKEWKKALEKIKDDPTSTGLNEKQLIEQYTNELIKDKNYQDGHYTVGDNMVTIKDSLVIDVE